MKDPTQEFKITVESCELKIGETVFKIDPELSRTLDKKFKSIEQKRKVIQELRDQYEQVGLYE